MSSVYAVIMAGGSGERFWPRSRRRMPKQFLPIVSKKSMLDETINRLKGVVPEDRIYIVTNKIQTPLVKGYRNVIAESVSRNTAPCIALSARIIQKRDPEAVMVVLPSDHYISDISKFQDTIKTAVKMDGVLVTLGIKPAFPHTGYGYIKKGKRLGNGLYKVSRFTEKPDLKTAKRYVTSGKYYWNSGMFIWRVDTILEEIKKYLPDLDSRSISIDYGVMEKTNRAVVLEAGFSWDDVGNWASLDNHKEKDRNGNVLEGDVVVKDVANSTIITDAPLVAGIGIRDMIVIATKDAVLICPKDRAEEVKSIVGMLKENKKYHERI